LTVPLVPLVWRAARVQADAVARETIAVAKREAGLEAPLTLAMARVVLRPAAATWTPVHSGVRLLAVEAGVLGITVEAPYRAPLTAAELTVSAAPPEPREEILLPAGTAMTFGARGVTSVRNPGARSVVLLDAVVFHGEPRPLPRAFTTDSGVSFQLLAGVTAGDAPQGKVLVTLERIHLRQDALPPDLCVGLTLLYLEAGALDVVAQAGAVATARAAASAPYAMPGAFQPLVQGERRAMTAGGVIFLPLAAAADLSNGSRRTAELLALTVRPASQELSS
jgi:hypothetical protein